MPRYVILNHDHPFPHWDFMLEEGDRLKTWRLIEQPAENALIPAEQLADHRLHYLDYEGPVSGNRGEVSRWDRGRFQGVGEFDPAVRLEMRVEGERLGGIVRLERRGDGWSFCYLPDRPSDRFSA